MLGSGWVPAALVHALAVVLLHEVGLVDARDTVAFTAWFTWAHTIPGTLLWRALDWRTSVAAVGGRPFVEDVTLGSVLGIVVGVPAYLLAVLVGYPLLVLAWPLLVLVPALASGRGRALLRRRQPHPTPAWWSWSMAAVLVVAVGYSAVRFWGPHALTTESLRGPYVDLPFHLSLVGEFRHHFPATVPYVSGTPLRYHWLVYPFMAAASWGAGVEPWVLVQLLAPAALSALMLLGVATAATRLSGRRWTGVAAAAVTAVLSPLDVMGWTDAGTPWILPTWVSYLSPTQAMANALAPLLVVVLAGMVSGAATKTRSWVLTAVVMFAVAGAKSAMLPLFVAGLGGTTVVMLVLRRRAACRVGGLAVLSVGVFVLASIVFYGQGSRALTWQPLQYVDVRAVGLGLTETGVEPSAVVRATLAAALVLCVALPAVGGIGLFLRGGWRRPLPWLLLGSWTAGVGVLLLMGHPGQGQFYFYVSGLVPLVLLGALGWGRAAGRMTRAKALVMGAALLAGLAWATVVAAVTSSRPPGAIDSTDHERMLASFWLPLGLAAGGVVLLVLLVGLLSRRVQWLRGRTLLVAISLGIGMCLPYPVALTAAFGNGTGTPDAPTRIPVREGGLEAAAWLRQHSSPDDLVATNSHTQMLSAAAAFDHRDFWISAYTERRVLVEGWAYVAPEVVGLPSTEANNAAAGPPSFWDQDLLSLNDEVFSHPTAAGIEELRQRYGVDWLFVDVRRGADLAGLRSLTTEQILTENYAVFSLKP